MSHQPNYPISREGEQGESAHCLCYRQKQINRGLRFEVTDAYTEAEHSVLIYSTDNGFIIEAEGKHAMIVDFVGGALCLYRSIDEESTKFEAEVPFI